MADYNIIQIDPVWFPKAGHSASLGHMDSLYLQQLDRAISARESFFYTKHEDPKHEAAFRLFNGFYEGDPDIVIDLYADTVLVQNYAQSPRVDDVKIRDLLGYLKERLSWIKAGVVKHRQSGDDDARNGILVFGEQPAKRLREDGIRYAFDLQLNRDAGFYLDTRAVRAWLRQEMAGKTVLNCFAYTGSLGVAALAGGASHVVQTDLNKRFLNVGKASYTLNGFKINRSDFVVGDFFSVVKQLNRAGRRFDCVIVDPPFFAQTQKGEIDLNRDTIRLLNKVRPLVNDQGRIVLINNALFLEGQQLYQNIDSLGQDGYLDIEAMIPIEADITGYPETIVREPVVDPAPFNHSTKVVILRVSRKK